MKRLGAVVVLVAALAACGSSTNTASRDQCEAQYGVGNCVSRHGTFVPLGLPLSSVPGDAATTTTVNLLDGCSAVADAARAASAVFYANNGKYPTIWNDLTGGNPPLMTLPGGVGGNNWHITNGAWRVTLTGGGTTPTTFTCSVDPNA